jgi:hypothetical protein
MGADAPIVAVELEMADDEGATGELCAETGLAPLNEQALVTIIPAAASNETNKPLCFVSNISNSFRVSTYPDAKGMEKVPRRPKFICSFLRAIARLKKAILS